MSLFASLVMAFFIEEAGIWVLPHIRDSKMASWMKVYWSYSKGSMEKLKLMLRT
jgi:hypothetical protein